MVDSRLAFDIMARDDGATAVLDKVARSADKTGNALKKNSKISEEAAKATEKLTKAHDNESTALERVHLAEEKLNEVRNNSKAKTSQVVAAENALSKARRDAAAAGNVAQKAAKDLEKVLENEGEKAGKGFGSKMLRGLTDASKNLKQWFTGNGKNIFKQIGENSGNGILGGITGVLKTPIVGPALALTLGAAVATAAPAIGSILAGGIVAGFGAGLAGLGLVFAAKSEAVQQQWKKTLDAMGSQMKTLSKPFENTLIAMSLVARRTFASFVPVLGEAFKRMAPVLAGFGDQLGRGLERLKPAILPLTDAFNAVIKALGPAVQDAIGKVSDGLVKLAASVQRSPGAIADLVRGMGDLVKTTLDLITMLNDANQKFKDLTGISAVTAVMDGLNGVLKGSELALRGITAPIGLLDSGLQKVGLKGKAASENQATFSSALLDTAASLNKVIPPAESLAQKFARQAAATNALITSLFRLSGLALTLSGSQTALAQAVADATQSIKDNGHTLDINTQKGRNNRNALDAVAQAANAQTEAMIRSGKGADAAGLAAERSRGNFVRIATQMGLSKKQAQALAAQLIAIPNVSREAKLKANKADLDAKLAAAKKQLADPNLTRERRAKLNAEIAALQAAVARAKAAIAGVQGKTVFIDAIVRQRGTIKAADPRLGVPGRAVGGPVAAGMPYIVGEHRPELFVPNQSGRIIPRIPAGGSTVNNFNVYVTGALDSRDAADKIVTQLRKFVRYTAQGNVQMALGR